MMSTASTIVNTAVSAANPNRPVRTWTQLNDGNASNAGHLRNVYANNGRGMMEPLDWKVSPTPLVRSEKEPVVHLTSPFKSSE